MVPSSFVRLDALPLNRSGKIDRQMLPAPALRRPDLSEAFVPPGTAMEEAIARIWSDVLRVDPVGIHDDFFDLGGHSLLATQVISRVSELFGRRVPLRCLFEAATVAGLARAVAEAPPNGGAGTQSSIQQAPRAEYRVKRDPTSESPQT